MKQSNTPASDHHDPVLLRRQNLAKLLQVSPRTVDTWTKGGVIPFYKIKGVTLFDLQKVMGALNRFEHKELRADVKLSRRQGD